MGDADFHLDFSLPSFYLSHGSWIGKAGILPPYGTQEPSTTGTNSMHKPELLFFSGNQKSKKSLPEPLDKSSTALPFTSWPFPNLSLIGFQVTLIQPEGSRLLCRSFPLPPCFHLYNQTSSAVAAAAKTCSTAWIRNDKAMLRLHPKSTFLWLGTHFQAHRALWDPQGWIQRWTQLPSAPLRYP